MVSILKYDNTLMMSDKKTFQLIFNTDADITLKQSVCEEYPDCVNMIPSDHCIVKDDVYFCEKHYIENKLKYIMEHRVKYCSDRCCNCPELEIRIPKKKIELHIRIPKSIYDKEINKNMEDSKVGDKRSIESQHEKLVAQTDINFEDLMPDSKYCFYTPDSPPITYINKSCKKEDKKEKILKQTLISDYIGGVECDKCKSKNKNIELKGVVLYE